MSSVTTNKMTNWRWVMCAMLFAATTVNYMDRQVLSLTFKEFIQPEFQWTDSDYGTITGVFSICYAVFCLFAGKFVDYMGTKKGYLIAISVWSLGAVMHAGCGLATESILGIEDLSKIEAGSAIASNVAMLSVYLFLTCRMVLGLGEAGNFPAAIKVTAEYFPKKDRAFATSIFNAGASVGALAAPATIPLLAKSCGWEMAFIIIGLLGFIWAGVWVFVYDKPAESKYVNEAELAYVNQDEDDAATESTQVEEKQMSFAKAFTYKQTWSFAFGKFMTDGVWWFFLFWAPAYFQDQFGIKASDPEGVALIFTLYAIVTVLSMFGGYLPKVFVEKKGMNPYQGRMLAMLIFAFFPVIALFAQPGGEKFGPWAVAIIIGIVGAGHQAWSANIFSTTGDMFPKSAVATITGIGAMAGGFGSFLINKGSGMLFTYAEEQGAAFSFMGFDGKPAGYMIIFCICAVAYLIGWSVMKALVPKYKQVVM